MVTRQASDFSDVAFWATRLMPCPYLPDRQERKILTQLESPNAEDLYDLLARNGFRRSHNWAYRPQCPGCIACVPVRVVASEFRESRNMRRVRRLNAGLSSRWCEPKATEEQYALFSRYVAERHAGGDMSEMTWEEYRAMIEDAPVRTGVVEWRDASGVLRAALLTDRLRDGISAVYSFFDPDDSARSPGTFIVLDTLAGCRSRGVAYLYLGYWVHESRKMSYKARFQPMEALGTAGWAPIVLPKKTP